MCQHRQMRNPKERPLFNNSKSTLGIVEGSYGPNDWVREIRDRCLSAKVPFFFKQWGGVIKKRNGRVLDGRTWDQMPRETQVFSSAMA